MSYKNLHEALDEVYENQLRRKLVEALVDGEGYDSELVRFDNAIEFCADNNIFERDLSKLLAPLKSLWKGFTAQQAARKAAQKAAQQTTQQAAKPAPNLTKAGEVLGKTKDVVFGKTTAGKIVRPVASGVADQALLGGTVGTTVNQAGLIGQQRISAAGTDLKNKLRTAGETERQRFETERSNTQSNDWRKQFQTNSYEMIKDHLLDEGYAESEKAALAIMTNMSEEWRQRILDSIQEDV